jgi:hypothetical protein
MSFVASFSKIAVSYKDFKQIQKHLKSTGKKSSFVNRYKTEKGFKRWIQSVKKSPIATAATKKRIFGWLQRTSAEAKKAEKASHRKPKPKESAAAPYSGYIVGGAAASVGALGAAYLYKKNKGDSVKIATIGLKLPGPVDGLKSLAKPTRIDPITVRDAAGASVAKPFAKAPDFGKAHRKHL